MASASKALVSKNKGTTHLAGRKYTDIQVDLRRHEIERLLLIPLQTEQIYQILVSPTKDRVEPWDIVRRTVLDDISKIREQWKKEIESRGNTMREEAVKRYERKLAKTEASGNWSANVAFEKLIGQVCGFLGPDVSMQKNEWHLVFEQVVNQSLTINAEKAKEILAETVESNGNGKH